MPSRSSVLRIPATPAATVAARAFLVHLDVAPAPLLHDLGMVATELVRNAVRHGRLGPRQRLVLRIVAADDAVRLEVGDPGPGFGPEVVTGPGLRIVEALADRWGVEVSGAGCVVWAEVDRHRDRALGAALPGEGASS